MTRAAGRVGDERRPPPYPVLGGGDLDLRALVESCADAAFIVDGQARALAWNAAAVAMLHPDSGPLRIVRRRLSARGVAGAHFTRTLVQAVLGRAGAVPLAGFPGAAGVARMAPLHGARGTRALVLAEYAGESRRTFVSALRDRGMGAETAAQTLALMDRWFFRDAPAQTRLFAGFDEVARSMGFSGLHDVVALAEACASVRAMRGEAWSPDQARGPATIWSSCNFAISESA